MMRSFVVPLALAASCALVGGCATPLPASGPTSTVSSSAASSPSTGSATTSPPTAGATTPAASTSPPAPAVPAGRFAFGDSVMLGSKKLLQGRGFTVDAKVGRQFGAAYNAIVKLREAHRLPRNVVIHLGTNGTIALRDCKAAVDAAGPDRRVFLVNVDVPRPWTHGNNVALGACDVAFPVNRVVVINWAAAAGKHRGWFGPDGVHPDAVGRRAYTDLITAAVEQRGL